MAYGLRARGDSANGLLPREMTFTLCQQFTLIGSGMIWNVYFGLLALWWPALCWQPPLARGQGASEPRGCANRRNGSSFSFAARPCSSSSSLATSCSLQPQIRAFPFFDALHRRVAGRAGGLVLQHLRLLRRDISTARCTPFPRATPRPPMPTGMSGWPRFKRVIWPTMLRLAWPAYTNEAIFLFHATTLVFFHRLSRTGNSAAMRCITPATLPTRPSTPSSPTPSLAMYFIMSDADRYQCFWHHQPSPQPAFARQCTPQTAVAPDFDPVT